MTTERAKHFTKRCTMQQKEGAMNKDAMLQEMILVANDMISLGVNLQYFAGFHCDFSETGRRLVELGVEAKDRAVIEAGKREKLIKKI
jgi:hypothetical protein